MKIAPALRGTSSYTINQKNIEKKKGAGRKKFRGSSFVMKSKCDVFGQSAHLVAMDAAVRQWPAGANRGAVLTSHSPVRGALRAGLGT